MKKSISIILIFALVAQLTACSYFNDPELNVMINEYEETKGVEELAELVVYTWSSCDYENFQEYGTIFFNESLNNEQYIDAFASAVKTYSLNEKEDKVIEENIGLYHNSMLWCYILSFLYTQNEENITINESYETLCKYRCNFYEDNDVNCYNSSIIALSTWYIEDLYKEKLNSLLFLYAIEHTEELPDIAGFLGWRYKKDQNEKMFSFFKNLCKWIQDEKLEFSVSKLNVEENLSVQKNKFKNKKLTFNEISGMLEIDGADSFCENNIMIVDQKESEIIFFGNPVISTVFFNKNTGDFEILLQEQVVIKWAGEY
ncbi:MAG: hypothetical protein IKC01_05315 [Clostridia bacterium]|nr:hypothetical protein [Clostridia bacterium]